MKRHALFAVAFLASVTGAVAQTPAPLSSYADADGFLDVQALTCAQLAGTY